MQKTVLILGASSAIAQASAEEFARKGYTLFLTGRHESALAILAKDLQIRFGVAVDYAVFDVCQVKQRQQIFAEICHKCPNLEGMLVAIGYLGDQQRAVDEVDEALAIVEQNFTGLIAILQQAANYFAKKKRGFIVVLGSVAGDRGRSRNYYYAAAKAALDKFMQGLRCYLYPQGVKVLTIKPGYVDTPMTFGSDHMFLVAKPEKIGKKIVKSIDKRREIVYLPWFWRYIMLVLKCIPEFIFKRLKI